MNSEIRIEMLHAAIRARWDQDTLDNVQRVADAIELAYMQGVAKGFDEGVTFYDGKAYQTGYEQGYADGLGAVQPKQFDDPNLPDDLPF